MSAAALVAIGSRAVTVLVLVLLAGSPGVRSADSLRSAAAGWTTLEARESRSLAQHLPQNGYPAHQTAPVPLLRTPGILRARSVADAFLPPPRAPADDRLA